MNRTLCASVALLCLACGCASADPSDTAASPLLERDGLSAEDEVVFHDADSDAARPEAPSPETGARSASFSDGQLGCMGGTPTNLKIRATSRSTIALTWVDNSSRESGFRLYRFNVGPVATYPMNATSGTLDILPGEEAAYSLYAIASDGCNSNIVSASLPGVPEYLLASYASPTRARLRWDFTVYHDNYRVERRVNGGTWATVATPPRNVTGLDIALRPGLNEFRVRAENANATAWYSPVAAIRSI